ncbi:MAG: TolB protein [Methanofollis sp.]|nr:TolB protein [Methanofollis sp.]
MKQKIICIILLLIACTLPAAAASPVPLTNDSALDSYPFWSPDGTEIAFTSFDGGHAGIRVMKSDGQNLRQVTGNDSWEFASFDPWSPDGKTLLFVSRTEGKFDLWTMKPDGSGRVRLTEGARIVPGLPLSGYGADWSADGKQIVYTSCLFENAKIWEDFATTAAEGSPAVNISEVRTDADIWIMDADGSGRSQLTTDGSARSPQWQPHGERIAYLSDRSGNRQVWTTNPDGTGAVQVTFSEGNVSEYTWSPDGTAIACVVGSAPGQEFSIRVTGIAENDTEQLTSGNRDQSPVWSPDGARIAFTSMSRNRTAVWTMKSDGSDLTPLTPGNATFFMMLQWSPDGKQIALSDGKNIFTVTLEEETTPASPGFGAPGMAIAFSLFVLGRTLMKRE